MLQGGIFMTIPVKKKKLFFLVLFLSMLLLMKVSTKAVAEDLEKEAF